MAGGCSLGETPWRAGMSLMAFDSPDSRQRVALTDQLIAANKETVAACWEAAAKAGKEQRCTITAPVPAVLLALCASEAGSFPNDLSDSDWIIRRYSEDRATGPPQQRKTR